mmetsp:Transcript_29796/g.80613  ORF Transcript_29796/g.80613 Transcript_29796/m.80613 type:complete len:505 (-) Transcript_29796:842-2356(-)
MHLQEGLNVHGVGQAGHLLHLCESLGKEGTVCGGLPGDGRAPRHVEVVIVDGVAGAATPGLALPQLAEDDALVGTDALLLLLRLLAKGPLRVLRGELQHLGKLALGVARAPLRAQHVDGRHLGSIERATRRGHEDAEALREPHGAVRALAPARVVLGELEEVDDHEEHLVLHLCRQGRAVHAELGHRDAEHGRQEAVAAQQEAPQGRLLGVGGVVDGLLALLALLVYVLRAVGPVRQHNGLRGNLRGLLLRLRRLSGALLLVLGVGILDDERQRVKGRQQRREHALDEILLLTVLAEEPQAPAQDTRLMHVRHRLGEPLQDWHPEVAVVRDQLAEEHHDLCGRGLVLLREEVHEEEHHALGLVYELPSARMERPNQQAPVLHVALDALRLVAHGLDDLLLEQGDHLLDVALADQGAQADVHDLLADVQRRASERAEDVHHHGLHDLLVMLLHFLQPIQHDQLHVVVGLLRQQRNIGLRSLVDGNRRGRQGHQGGGAVVGDGRGG